MHPQANDFLMRRRASRNFFLMDSSLSLYLSSASASAFSRLPPAAVISISPEASASLARVFLVKPFLHYTCETSSTVDVADVRACGKFRAVKRRLSKCLSMDPSVAVMYNKGHSERAVAVRKCPFFSRN